MNEQPIWNATDRSASLTTFGKWLHEEAIRVFNEDKTHTHLIFLFDRENGLISLNQVPPNTSKENLLAGVKQSIEENDIYGVISVAEAWTYVPRYKGDHTVVQILHNEMGVADLNDDDRTEALLVMMESKDGDHIIWMDKIIRDGDNTRLGVSAILPKEKCINLKCFFDD